jgi:hypothetical protein
MRPMCVLLCMAAALLAGCATCPTCPVAGTAGLGSLAWGPMAGLDLPREGVSARASTCDENWRDGNADARPIAPGETLVLADLEGPGRINHIWNTVAAQERGYSRLLVVRMYWDGEEEPSVLAPLGDLFVIGNGIDRPFQSLPVVISSEGRARNCYWPMPFRKSARITVTNEGEKPIMAFYSYVDWQKLPALPEDTPYFHAMYRQEYPTVMGQNYLLADIVGKGHYVGTVMNIRQHQASWYGEGDDFFFIDGETEPSIRGTGSEDYFCDAWGFRKFDGPYYGVPVWGNYEQMSLFTAYRWHLTDPVVFNTALRVEIEHKGVTFDPDGTMRSGFEEREDDFASVAYWYQTEPHKPYEPLPPAYDRLFVDPRTFLEAEAMIGSANATEGSVSLQEGFPWSGNGQIFWTPQTDKQTIEMVVEVTEDGTYFPALLMTVAPDYGMFRVLVNGEPVGRPIDLYSGGVSTDLFTLPAVALKAGANTLAFENVGKTSESTGFYFGFDAYALTKED